MLGSSVFIPNENYNSRRQSGIEARITYRRHFGDFGLEVGADMIWYKPRYVNYSEIDYPEHLELPQPAAGRPMRSGACKPTGSIRRRRST